MELSGYISLQSFVEGCTGPAGEPAFILQAENLLYTVPEEEYQYGLSLLRKAIGAYEAQKGIPLESSKQAIPFFREKRRMLIGPEMELYKFSFYENETVLPEKVQSAGQPYLRLSFDYEQLAEHCLFENIFLVRCKYDEKRILDNFITQMDREYDKFFFDYCRFAFLFSFMQCLPGSKETTVCSGKRMAAGSPPQSVRSRLPV